MRTNLITQFYCTKCGNQLLVEYDNEEFEFPEQKASLEGQTLPTGAQCRYNKIYVQPCQGCINKELAPARALAEAIKSIQ